MIREAFAFYNQNKKVIGILLFATFCLIGNYYLSNASVLKSIITKNEFSSSFEKEFFYQPNSSLIGHLYWALIHDLIYLSPLLLIVFVYKEKPSAYGLSFKIGRSGLKYYLVFMLFMLPLVCLFSQTEAFKNKYPFYVDADSLSFLSTKQLIWELAYCSQFFTLEFFFRGFMVNGLKKEFGVFSIVIMTIPYTMIHFGKPWPETLGAVFAGLALGYLSFKEKSILAGFLMHITVALTMDLLSLS